MNLDASDVENLQDDLTCHMSEDGPQTPTSTPPAKRRKLDHAADEQFTFTESGSRSEAIGRLNELSSALAGPKKRGRPVGSGADERRKKNEDYSPNANAQKDRRRRQKLNVVEKEVYRSAGADRVAKSRALKKIKESEEYQDMTPEERKIYEDITVSELFEERDATYSKQFVLAKLRAERELLADRLGRTQEFIAVHSDLAKRDHNHDIFWEDCDSEDDDDNGAVASGMVDEVNDIRYDLTDTITAVILDGLANDTKPVESYKGVGHLTDEREVFKAARKRQQSHPQLMSQSHRMWVIFRRGVLEALAGLDTKIKKLDSLGDLRTYSYNIPKILDAISNCEIKLDALRPIKNYRQVERYLVYGDIAPAWKRLILAGKASPTHIFSDRDRGLLRSLWGADKAEWIELPGPADCWPDDPSWYVTNGFEPRVDQHDNYRKAIETLNSETGPQGWEEYLLHDNARYDLVWNKYFGIYGA